MTRTGSERAEKSERIRAFVALEPPPRVVSGVLGWQRRALAGREGLRPVAPAALHLTLAFLGDRDPEELAGVRAALEAIEPRPVRIDLDPTPLPLPRRRPRVLALAARSPDAVALQRELVAELVARGLYEAEGRPFRPHLSVARVRGRGGSGTAPRETLRGLPGLSPDAARTFDAVRVALYRSQLRSQGARYDALAAYDLPPASGG